MREVAILGIGQTPVAEHWDKSVKELAGLAAMNALSDAGRDRVDGLFVGNMLSGILSRQENLATLVADWIGLLGIETYKIEAACASGSAALREGIIAIASGSMDSALVIGVEKMTENLPVETTAGLATAADADYETGQGLSFVALNALIMRRYIHEFDWKHSDFANFSINAHKNAMANPYARLREEVNFDSYSKARMIADPINLLDASPIGDGAAAVLLVPIETIRQTAHPQIRIAGSASATDTIAVHDRRDPLWLTAAEKSAAKAYKMAEATPDSIDFFELHDAFSIMAALSLEACGFIGRGGGPRLALDGEITLNGKIPVATLGGLKARGHPVGATGIYQIVEATLQLRDQAGKNQVPNARVGMTQNIGGSGATVVTNILQRDD
jgi:acetyl-CoA C-acetyltransferase